MPDRNLRTSNATHTTKEHQTPARPTERLYGGAQNEPFAIAAILPKGSPRRITFGGPLPSTWCSMLSVVYVSYFQPIYFVFVCLDVVVCCLLFPRYSLLGDLTLILSGSPVDCPIAFPDGHLAACPACVFTFCPYSFIRCWKLVFWFSLIFHFNRYFSDVKMDLL